MIFPLGVAAIPRAAERAAAVWVMFRFREKSDSQPPGMIRVARRAMEMLQTLETSGAVRQSRSCLEDGPISADGHDTF